MPRYSLRLARILPPAGEVGTAAAPEPGPWVPLVPGADRLFLDASFDATGIVYATGADGSAWRSRDGGETWVELEDLGRRIAVRALAPDPSAPDVLYAGGTGRRGVDHSGVWRSIDGGDGWRLLPGTADGEFAAVHDLIVSPQSGDDLYAATGTGVWRSLDRGASWSRSLATAAAGGCVDLALGGDLAGDVLFASCGAVAPAAVYRNLDAGGEGSWRRVLPAAGSGIPALGRTVLRVGRDQPRSILALSVAGSAGGACRYRTWLSEDGGERWAAGIGPASRARALEELCAPAVPPPGAGPAARTPARSGTAAVDLPVLPRAGRPSSVVADPLRRRRIFVTYAVDVGPQVWRSDDGGFHWRAVVGAGEASLPRVAVHTLVILPGGAGRLAVGSDLGVFVSPDGGGSWYAEKTGFGAVPTPALEVRDRELYAVTAAGTWKTRLRSRALQVGKSGGGRGTVISRPSGAVCGPRCPGVLADFAPGTAVRLTAVPAPGSVFSGWRGACRGTGPCRVRLTEDAALTAWFVAAETAAADPRRVARAGAAGPAGRGGEPAAAGTPLPRQSRPPAPAGGPGPAGVGERFLPQDFGGPAHAASAAPSAAASLTVRLGGSGEGTVASLPAGVYCPPACDGSFEGETAVILVAMPGPGSRFSSWRGSDCGGEAICRVPVPDRREVTASFARIQRRELQVDVLGDGGGRVLSEPAGIDCGTDCAEIFADVAEITLTAVPEAGSRFVAWEGACSGSAPSCRLRRVEVARAAAVFAPARPPLTVEMVGEGRGRVELVPNGAVCRSPGCSLELDFGTGLVLLPAIDPEDGEITPAGGALALRPVAAPGSVFAGWRDSCPGRRREPCEITLHRKTTLVAVFRRSAATAARRTDPAHPPPDVSSGNPRNSTSVTITRRPLSRRLISP